LNAHSESGGPRRGVLVGCKRASGWVVVTGKQGSRSFLKKRTKKLLSGWLTRLIRPARTKSRKSFLVLFFKKELLPCYGAA
jgi:hypothetical protein